MAAQPSFRSVSVIIVEPLKRIHAMLSISSYLQGPNKLLTTFYSTPQTPISPPPSFETTPTARFLLNECGFSIHKARIICMKNLALNLFSHKSYDNSWKNPTIPERQGFWWNNRPKTLFQIPFHFTVQFPEQRQAQGWITGENGLHWSEIVQIHREIPCYF